MPAAPDPYAVLGVARGATDAAIHAAYRGAVRRTHPDAGGSAAEFEAVQEAYEVLRDPARRRAWDARSGAARPSAGPAARADAGPARDGRARRAGDPAAARRAMEDLLAESQRLEDEARALAGLSPRDRPASTGEGAEDSVGAVLRDAGQELRTAAAGWSRELGRLVRRLR